MACRPRQSLVHVPHRHARVLVAAGHDSLSDEVGCGEGISGITIAKAYENVEIDGDDLDDVSIAIARDGAVLVVDERTEDSFTVPTGEMERLFYAFSALHCLAVEPLDVDHPQFRPARLF
jgi:hypothetical protein